MKLLITGAFLSIFIFADAKDIFSQNKIILGDIIVTGNEKTDEDIILREIHSKQHSPLDTNTLKEDINRIQNLALFNKVEIIPVPVSADTINLIINVEESFYFIPIPQGGFKDVSIKKFWGGARLNWRNFRGRNETLSTSFGLGYEPFVSFSYSNPWIGNHYFTSASIKYSRSVNRTASTAIISRDSLPEYKVNNFETGLTIGKYFTPELSIDAGISYNYIKLSEFQPDKTLSPDGIDRFTSLFISANYDKRDLRNYTTKGTYADLKVSQFGINNKYHSFGRLNGDFRKYIPVKLSKDYYFTLAARSYSALSFGGNIPTYMLENFGYDKLIRGWQNKVISGENLLSFYSELRFPVIMPAFISGKKLPIIKKISILKNLSYRYGLYGTLFFDIGSVWNRNQNISDIKFLKGYGAGLNFLLPFNFIGRVDLAFSRQDERMKTSILLSLNASF